MNTYNQQGLTSKRPGRRSMDTRKVLPIIGIVMTLTALIASFVGAFADPGGSVPLARHLLGGNRGKRSGQRRLSVSAGCGADHPIGIDASQPVKEHVGQRYA